MNSADCETVLLSAMALADGEPAPLARDAIREHVKTCNSCREEIHRLEMSLRSWERLRKPELSCDLWPNVRSRISGGAPACPGRPVLLPRPLIILIAALVASRAVILCSDSPSAWVARMGALLIVCVVFLVLKQNPFAIEPQLFNRKEQIP